MKFCENCNNMFYVGISDQDSNKLIYYCRHCGNKSNQDAIEKNIVILNTQIKKTEQNFSHIVNKYTKYDPTLPRIKNVHCPNPECETNKSVEERPSSAESGVKGSTEVIYMRYDDDNLKYLYICTACDTTWKTQNS